MAKPKVPYDVVSRTTSSGAEVFVPESVDAGAPPSTLEFEDEAEAQELCDLLNAVLEWAQEAA